MDPHYYTRYAMAGWVFVAVIVGSAAESNWPSLCQFVKTMTENGSGFSALLLGAAVGIGAPPAVGFLLERLTSLFLMGVAGNMWLYPQVRSFSCRPDIKDDPPTAPLRTYHGPAAFHICFYSLAGESMLGWARRRRMQMYASLTSVVAILGGLVVSAFAYHCVGPITLGVSLVFVAALLVHGIRESHYHKRAVSTWAEALAAKIAIPDCVAGPHEAVGHRAGPDFTPDRGSEVPSCQ